LGDWTGSGIVLWEKGGLFWRMLTCVLMLIAVVFVGTWKSVPRFGLLDLALDGLSIIFVDLGIGQTLDTMFTFLKYRHHELGVFCHNIISGQGSSITLIRHGYVFMEVVYLFKEEVILITRLFPIHRQRHYFLFLARPPPFPKFSLRRYSSHNLSPSRAIALVISQTAANN
jgi:hypothetical protein